MESNDKNEKLREGWTKGNFGKFDKFGLKGTEEIFSRLDLRDGMHVLDAGCGSGNMAILAAQRGCRVTGIDINPAILEQAREKAKARSLNINFETGDIEQMRFEDGSFDAVLSIFAAIFVPDAEKAASEMRRVCRPGGYIAMTSQSPEGFSGQMARLIMSYAAPPSKDRLVPDDSETFLSWGLESKVRERFHRGFSEVQITKHMFPLEFPFDEAGVVEFYKENMGPIKAVFSTINSDRQQALTEDLIRLWKQKNKVKNGTTVAEAEYLLVIARKSM